MISPRLYRAILLYAQLSGGLVAGALAASPPTFGLLTNTTVDGDGIFFSQVVAEDASAVLPRIRLSDAPAFGQAIFLTRTQIIAALEKAESELICTNWTGAERVRVTRHSRAFTEAEVKEQLTALLQRDYVREKGELELRFTRPWHPVAIPGEPYTLRILDLPTLGVSASFITRFELSTTREVIGTWQVAAQAKVWREIWVARSTLRRDQLLSEADVSRERRDVLGLRDTPLALTDPDGVLEIAESIPAGAPIYARSVRLRPVVRRGQLVEAQFQDGTVTIALKVEVMENGAPGQTVRVRNVQSKREFRGKVQNEQTILVSL